MKGRAREKKSKFVIFIDKKSESSLKEELYYYENLRENLK